MNIHHLRFLLILTLFFIISIASGCSEAQENQIDFTGAASLQVPTDAPTDVPTEVPTTLPTETSSPTASPTKAEPSGGIAAIEGIDIAVAGMPPRVQVTAIGNLQDSCTQIDGVTTELTEDTFLVTIMTQRAAETDCGQELVPFEERVQLDTQDLAPGTYVVDVNGVRASFELPGEEEEATETPEPARTPMPTATVSVTPRDVAPGASVNLTAIGLPADTEVEIGAGPEGSEYDIIRSATTDANGRLNVQVTLPEEAEAGDAWVFVVLVEGEPVLSEPVSVLETEDSAGDEDTMATNIYLIALEDNGASGPAIGCGDSVVPVEVQIEETITPLRDSLERLMSIDDEFYGESGLYNALSRSDLRVRGINLKDGTAIIHLTGDLRIGGVCDAPRVQAQLEQTALQFSTVTDVEISIDGTPLEELLSGN